MYPVSAVADPDIRLGHIRSTEIRLGNKFMFLSISRLFLRWKEPRSITKLGGDHGWIRYKFYLQGFCVVWLGRSPVR